LKSIWPCDATKELEDQNNPVSLQRFRSEAVLWVSWTPGPHVQAHCSKPHRPGGQMAMNILSQLDTNQIQIIMGYEQNEAQSF